MILHIIVCYRIVWCGIVWYVSCGMLIVIVWYCTISVVWYNMVQYRTESVTTCSTPAACHDDVGGHDDPGMNWRLGYDWLIKTFNWMQISCLGSVDPGI